MSDPGWSPSNFVTLTAEAQRRAVAPTRQEFDGIAERVDKIAERVDKIAETNARLARIEERQTRNAEDVAKILVDQQILMERIADQRRDISTEIDTKIDDLREDMHTRISPTESDVRILMGIKERVWWIAGALTGIISAVSFVGSDRLMKIAARLVG